MNKTIKKYISYILFTALTIVGLSPMAQAVSASDYDNHKTDVIITKLETDADVKDMTIDELENGISDLDGWFGTTAKPLEGISFTYYKVDDLDAVSGLDTPDKMEAAGYGEGTEVGPTKEDGTVTLDQLENGKYWVVENPNSLVTSSKAVPFGLELPFTNAAGDGYLETIYVYPKNTVTREEPEIEKEVDKVENEIGEVHTWTVGIDVPEGVGSYEELGFIDEIDSRLDWVGNVKVQIPGGDELIEGTHYTVNYDAGGTGIYAPQEGKSITGTLTVEFEKAGLAFLEAEGASRVETSFDTKINDTAEVNEAIPNRPGLTFDNGIGNFAKPGDPDNPPKTPEDPDPVVKTLGVKVLKVDSLDDTPLEDAEFILRNKDGQEGYFTKDANDIYVFEEWVDAGSGTKLVTNFEGLIDIKGLADNTSGNNFDKYTLIEVKAPKGYALPSGDYREFEIPVDETTHEVEYIIENTKMTIPQTGGIGTVIFTLIGGMIMTLSVIYYRKTEMN